MATRTAGRTRQPARWQRPAFSPVPTLIFAGVFFIWFGAKAGTLPPLLVGAAAIVTAAALGIRVLARWIPVLLGIYGLVMLAGVLGVFPGVHA